MCVCVRCMCVRACAGPFESQRADWPVECLWRWKRRGCSGNALEQTGTEELLLQ